MTKTELLLILGMALVTFGIRYVLLAIAHRVELPEILKESLNYIAPAVLMAITVPAVLMPTGEIHLSFENPYLISAVLAVLAGLISKNLLVTILVGLIGFFVHQLIF